MTTHQLIPAKPAGTAPPSFTPVRGGLLQRKCACGGTPGPTGECEGCRQKRNGIEGTFQRRAANTAESALAPPIVQEVMPSPGQQRDPAARDFIEPRFGHDFSRVRVHPDEKAATSAATVAKLIAGLEQLSGIDLSDVRVHFNSSEPAQLNALAYTQGKDIQVGPGQEKHLPHEGWHVVQQMQGRVKPTIQAKGISINDDDGLEREADVM